MLIKILLNIFLGYVNIKVESFYIERFINLCISKRIFLWNIKRKKSSILYANIGIKDFKRLKQILRKTNSKAQIQSKKGLPFFLHKYRKRKIFVILIGLIIAFLIVISNFIWNIEINGNENISVEEIIQELKKDGLNIGVLKGRINTNLIINKVRLNRDDIAWIGIDVKGTNAIVTIKEASKKPEIVDENEYCNIVADKDGMITKINVQNGTALVKEGDIVKKGDILIAGYMEGKYTGIRYVHAMGQIEAKVWYSKKEKQSFKQKIKIPTGATEVKFGINFKNFQINFYKTLSKFQNYDTISEEKKIVLFSNFYLPIKIKKITNNEFQFKYETYTEEELTQILEEKLKEEIVQEIESKDKIIDIKTNKRNDEDGFLEVEVIYEVLENIGNKEKIIF